MEFAEVAVDAPLSLENTLTYCIPNHMSVRPGNLVWVPLGRRPVQGVVFSVSGLPRVLDPRQIISVIGPYPVLSTKNLDLAKWISSYYMCSLYQAAALFLPPGFKGQVNAFISVTDSKNCKGVVKDDEKDVLNYIRCKVAVPENIARRDMGTKKMATLAKLVRNGVLRKSWVISRKRSKPRFTLSISNRNIGDHLLSGLDRTAPRQASLLRTLVDASQSIPAKELRAKFGSASLNGLIKKGLVIREWSRVVVSKQLGKVQHKRDSIVLNPEQEMAVQEIGNALGKERSSQSFLLYGVTGSGKTEVYLRALERCVFAGRQGLMLVPEISLTPQMMDRVNERFPGRTAIIHSGQTLREQFDTWWGIWDGSFDVIVGPRSALFAPVSNLGLVIIDEEHEWTYKQQDKPPRFHVRETALKLTQQADIPVVLGTATPDVTTFNRAQRSRHKLLILPNRIGHNHMPRQLAKVYLVDMRKELREGNRSPFSRRLSKSLLETMANGKQAMLFLNRRGSATLVQCRDCGNILGCKRCDVSLTYHRDIGLVCHQCARRESPPERCPICVEGHIRYLGLGTEKVVVELEGLFPGIRVSRWDSDSKSDKGNYHKIMEEFSSGRTQVLVGTQMIAKGLHFPNVSVVGVVQADIGLYFPDFRAGERTFQLLCQVAGRTGRGLDHGEVIFQTYLPDNYAIRTASQQDYYNFYIQEMELRKQQRNPPFSRLVHMVYVHTNEEACKKEASMMARTLKSEIYNEGMGDLEIVGPAPGHPTRIRGRYRWHMIIRGLNPHLLLNGRIFPKGWSVDVDPVNVL